MKIPPIETGFRRLTSIGAGAAATNGVASGIRPKHDRNVQDAIDRCSGVVRDARRARGFLIDSNSPQQ
jgi:hypothetical protein